ncbi:MAG: hypothetical protein E5X60_31875 [Mesorhizobium sp.]|nr:MAG: hypothetical protein E5X60_31875 [Mesorhizobium sp.]
MSAATAFDSPTMLSCTLSSRVSVALWNLSAAALSCVCLVSTLIRRPLISPAWVIADCAVFSAVSTRAVVILDWFSEAVLCATMR